MKRYTWMLFFCLFFANSILAEVHVKGQVVNRMNKPLANANVLIQETQQGTITDSNGFFTIENVKPGAYNLNVSLLGYGDKATSFVLEKSDKVLPTVVLQDKVNDLGEVFVIASGRKTKKPSTSLRLKTPIKELPQNIQVINSELIENQQLTNMLDGVSRNVSGVLPVEHWGHFARVNMRGFRLPAFRNGVNIQDTWGPLSEDMFLVDRVEFVKGPAGFMMSAGEPGGFYNVVTKKPVAQRLAKLSFVAGTQDTYRAAVDLGGKLEDTGKLLYRFNTMYQKAGTHRKYEETSRWGISPALSYAITDKTKLLAEYSYQKADAYIGAAYVFAPTGKGYGSLDRDFTMIDDNFPKTDIREISFLSSMTHDFNENWSAEMQYVYMDYNQEGYSFWPQKAVTKNGDVTRGISNWDALSRGDYFQLYLSGKFTTGFLGHSLLGGFDFTRKNYWADWSQGGAVDVKEPFNIYRPKYGNSVIPAFNKNINIKEREAVYTYGTIIRSFYLQDELSLLKNKLRLTLAARHTQLTPKGEETVRKLTPRVGISADITPQITIYGLYDESFMPAEGTPRAGEEFDPIQANIYETGVKSSFFNRRLTASLTGYLITKKNLSVADPKNKGEEKYSIQLGEVESKGIEFDMQGKITEELRVLVNYALTNVETTKDTNPANVGKKLGGYAKHITNAWVNYNFSQNSALKGFGLSLGYQYQIDRASWSWSPTKTDLPDYFRMDGALTWANEKLKIALNVNNILNEYLYSGSDYQSYIYWQTEPGINGRLSVSYTF